MSGDQNLIDAIAREAARHQWWAFGSLGVPGMPDRISFKCLCGWHGAEPEQHTAEHILAALRSKYAIVEKPAPDSTRYEGDEHEHTDRPSWSAGEYAVSVWNQGEVEISSYTAGGYWITEEPISTNDARRFATALLAAADTAEGEKK